MKQRFHSPGARSLLVAAVVAVVPWSVSWSVGPVKIPLPERLLTTVVRPDFRNQLFSETPVDPEAAHDGLALFNGAIHGEATEPPIAPPGGTPNDGATFLVSVSFGQPFASDTPFPGFAQEAIQRAGKLLEYDKADAPDGMGQCPDDPANGQFCRDNAAYRFKHLMYEQDPLDPDDVINVIDARIDGRTMSDFGDGEPLYGDAERQRSVEAERIVRNALKYAPHDVALRNALLDIYHDRLVAETLLAKEIQVAATRRRLEPFDPMVTGFAIDREIDELHQVVGTVGQKGTFRDAVAGYFELLNDPMGVDVSAIDPESDPTEPFGYHLFRHQVPNRSPAVPSFLKDGEFTPVITQPVFSGFKDLVALFSLFRDHADAVADLATLYVARDLDADPPAREADRDIADLLVRDAHQGLQLDGELLLGIFDPADLPPAGDRSGLAEAVARWRSGLSRLNGVRDVIRGDTNLLGFADDFMMFIKVAPNAQDTCFETFNVIQEHLDSPHSALRRAKDQFDIARNSYDTYRANQDQLALQFENRNERFTDRLRAITGVLRLDPDGSFNQDYFTPHDNAGSEIRQQHLNIEIAELRIQRNQVRLDALNEQINIVVETRNQVRALQDAISEVIVDFGTEQASLTQTIADISAAQIVASSQSSLFGRVGQAFNDIGSKLGNLFSKKEAGAEKAAALLAQVGLGVLDGMLSAGNAKRQARYEQRKGQVQAEKERLAAIERATINDINSQILDLEAEKEVRILLLQMGEIAVDTLEAELLVTQELDRLTGLVKEWADLERRLNEANEGLVDRFFADPIHRLRLQSDVVEYERTLRWAQRWVYFLARAFEFKWNQVLEERAGGGVPDVDPTIDQHYSIKDILRARHVEELERIVDSLREAEFFGCATPNGSDVSRLSLRDDVFGYRLRDCSNCAPALYPDPQSGELVNGIQAFRSRLRQLVVADPTDDEVGHLRVHFSTARDLTPFHPLFSPGTWNDKIEWVKIKIPGNHDIDTILATRFCYGGTAFLRNESTGTLDPQDPTRVEGELRAYSTRFWQFLTNPTSDDDEGNWQQIEELCDPTARILLIPSDPEFEEEEVDEITTFQQRSSAATGWTLVLPPELEIDKINDIKIFIKHHFRFPRNEVGKSSSAASKRPDAAYRGQGQ